MSESSPEKQQISFRLVPPADDPSTPRAYANFMQATASPADITLHFGWYAIPAFDQPLSEPPDEAIDVPVHAVLKLSLPLNIIPGVINVLQAQLAAWQETFGREQRAEQEANV